MMRLKLVCVIALLTCLLCAREAPAGKPNKPGGASAYTIVPFRPLNFPSTSSDVSALNDQGHAVGYAELQGGDLQAVHLDMATGVYTALRGGAVASGVNNLNQIVGEDGVGGGLLWSSPSAQPATLSPLSGDSEVWISAISDDGIVVGTSLGPNQSPRSGVVWRVVVDGDGVAHVSGPVPLPPLPGDLASSAADINNLAGGFAQVAGTSRYYGLLEAVIWTVEVDSNGALFVSGPMDDLGTLGLLSPSQSDGAAVNNFGDVGGVSDEQACVWPAGLNIQSLPTFGNTQRGFVADINDTGQLAGGLDVGKVRPRSSYVPDWRASLWKNGQVIDLTSQIGDNSGWSHLWWANAINNSGIIAGSGRFDADRGFLLIPNP